MLCGWFLWLSIILTQISIYTPQLKNYCQTHKMALHLPSTKPNAICQRNLWNDQQQNTVKFKSEATNVYQSKMSKID